MISSAASALSHQEAVTRARELLPGFAERAEEAEAARCVPRTNIAELRDSGLFGIATPRRWGGSELPPETWIEVIAEIAAVCGSTGWVYGVMLGHNWLVSQFPDATQAEVFGSPDTLVASLVRLGGTTPQRVPGGYRWRGAAGRFCSGVDYAGWVVAGGTVQPDGDARWFLIPREDFEIDDDWYTSGLRGTGSNSIRVPDAFIPEHHSIGMRALDAGQAPGRAVNGGPLYGLPGSTWAFVLPATPLGIARGAVEAVRSSLRQRFGDLDQERLAEQSALIARFARAASDVEIANMLLLARARRMLDVMYSPLERAQHRRDIAYAVQQARRATNDLMELSGGSGLYATATIQRMWRDCNAAAAHASFAWEPAAVAYGRALLDV
jgi:alkylation response protein AidB-like acyl-CoA dehydrogenase